MAKSKRSAALFEVIQASRQPAGKPLSPIKRWWLGANHVRAFPFQPAKPVVAPQHAQVVPPPTDPQFDADPFDDQMPQPGSAAASTDSFEDLPEPVSASYHTPARQPLPGVDLELDPDHQQITFKVSYYSAIITSFTVMVVIILAFVIGRKLNRGPVAATNSPSSAELRSQPAHPDVLDVSNRTVEPTPIAPKVEETAQLAGNTALAPTPPSTPAVDAQRIIGRQYVVIQIYPDKKNADNAAALLNQNNIPCTVENGLAGWASKSWWCVVGTTGFDHVRANPDYQHYEAAILRLNAQQSDNPKFKKFEPRAYRWKEATT
jgi:hypothetical protein